MSMAKLKVAWMVLFATCVSFYTMCVHDDERDAVLESELEHDPFYAPHLDDCDLEQKPRNWRFKEKYALKKKYGYEDAAGRFLNDALWDIMRLHGYLFDWDSFKIITSVFPPYIFSRMVDNRLQNQFYDYKNHKNENQFPHWFHEVAEKSIAVPIVFFGLSYLTTRNVELKQSSRMFLLGMPFVIFGKDLLKRLEWNFCKRPWNEKFDCDKRAYGGFPSGHIAEATYTAVMFGMRYGLKAAVPLGILTGAIGITFLNCNRHYLSQLVAGAGLGAMYAIAANKIVDTRLHDNLSIGLAMNDHGGPSFALSYQF